MKKIILPIGVIAVILLLLAISWILYLRRAHSTFDNYYAFRGCQELINKTDDFGLCRIKNGKVIKIVKYQNRWYLDGDLPSGHFPDF